MKLPLITMQDLLTKIDEEAKDYMDQAKDITPDEKNQRIGDINKSFTKCKEYGDDKLSLAMQVWNPISASFRVVLVPSDRGLSL